MHSQKKRALKTLALFSLLLLASVIIKNKNGSSIRIRSLDSSSPLLKSFHNISTLAKRIIPFASYREENRTLKKKIDYLTRKLEEQKVLADENQRLKDILNFRKAVPYTTIPAQVIGRDPSNWSNSLIIDKGLNHGIRQNKAVISMRGLVGRVVEVGRYSGRILLITDPNSKVGVVIQKNNQGGILVGRPDGRCKMIYIALDSDVGPGDKVITAGFGTVFPKGMPVGEVLKVDKEPGRLYKYAIVKPIEDLSKIEEILCLR